MKKCTESARDPFWIWIWFALRMRFRKHCAVCYLANKIRVFSCATSRTVVRFAHFSNRISMDSDSKTHFNILLWWTKTRLVFLLIGKRCALWQICRSPILTLRERKPILVFSHRFFVVCQTHIVWTISNARVLPGKFSKSNSNFQIDFERSSPFKWADIQRRSGVRVRQSLF